MTTPQLTLDENHVYHLGKQKIPGVSECLDAFGFISRFAKREDARVRGTIVHAAMALFGRGVLDFSTVDARILGYVLSGILFYEQTGFKPAIIETPDYHPDYLYGYTIDAVGSSRFGDLLPDFKTGKAPKLATSIQLAAYTEAMRHKYGGKFRTVAVELDKDGESPHLQFYGNEREDWNNFLSVLNVFRLLERT